MCKSGIGEVGLCTGHCEEGWSQMLLMEDGTLGVVFHVLLIGLSDWS